MEQLPAVPMVMKSTSSGWCLCVGHSGGLCMDIKGLRQKAAAMCTPID